MKSRLSKDDLKYLNERGVDELYAANAYRYGATCFLKMNLLGFVKFCREQSTEELEHRTGIELFVNDLGEELDMPAIPKVEFPEETPKGILTFLLNMEDKLLENYELGCDDGDRWAVRAFCIKKVDDQREGVGALIDLLAELESVGVGFVNQRLQA